MGSHSDQLAAGIPSLKCPNADLLDAAQLFVEAKSHLDALNRTRSGSLIVSQILPDAGGYSTTNPHGYAFDLIPFLCSHRKKSERAPAYKALVPTSMVIGESWRWRPEHLEPSEQENVVRVAFKALADSEETHAGRECADYSYIKPLGIVLAHEGKNRVALFKHKGLPYIPAVVSEEDYPAPERIRVFETNGACIAVLDHRFAEQVKAPNLVRQLLEVYGVTFEKEWPSEYPSLERVLRKFDDLQGRIMRADSDLDMQPLAIEEQAENSEARASLCDIEGVQALGIKSSIWALATLLALVALIQFTTKWSDLRTFLVFASGVLSALLIAPALPVLKCRVKNLKGNLRRQQFFERRNELSRQLRHQEAGE